MKKVIMLLLVLGLIIGLSSCEKSESADGSADVEETGPVTWPNGDVTILAGYAVGSRTDINLHTVADWITEQTGVTVRIENNDTGGGANLATQLVNAKPDGQTMMLIGMNAISNYYAGFWSVNPCDTSKFKLACGAIQPYPDSGCILLTQAEQPYSNWDELAAYAAANPGTVTVASIAGKVMDSKMKGLFNGTGVADDIRWVSTTNADASAGLLGGNINIVILDEWSAAGYLKDGKLKAVINSRDNNDYSYYKDSEEKDIIMSVPTLVDVFGEEKGKSLAVPNRSMFVVPAATPDEIVDQIAAVVDTLGEVTEGEYYERTRINGGTSKYYTWPGKEVMAEWNRLDPVIKEIVEMGR